MVKPPFSYGFFSSHGRFMKLVLLQGAVAQWCQCAKSHPEGAAAGGTLLSLLDGVMTVMTR